MVSSTRSRYEHDRKPPELLVGISVRTSGDAVEAAVALDGPVCPSTVPQVTDALERLANQGATLISIDLSGVDLCTSHGFDAFDRIHRALQADGGHVELRGAHGAVARCLRTLHDLDPTFLRPSPS